MYYISSLEDKWSTFLRDAYGMLIGNLHLKKEVDEIQDLENTSTLFNHKLLIKMQI